MIAKGTKHITTVLHEEKAAYIISRGEIMAEAQGQPYSHSYVMNKIVDFWLGLGAPSLGPGDKVIPVPVFPARKRWKREE